MKKILIIVLSYNDNAIYSKFYKAQKETWGSVNVNNVETYYLFGNHHRNEIIGNEILTNINEPITTIRKLHLNHCGRKTIEAFELVKDFDFDYIFRTNSSSYVDKQLLLNYSLDKPTNNYYSAVIGNFEGVLFASGSGYFISKDLVNLVLENKDKWDYNFGDDDNALGKLLNAFGVRPQPNNRFDILNQPANIAPMDYFHYRLKSSDRNIDIHNMYELFRLKAL
jgi:hypothetical protein